MAFKQQQSTEATMMLDIAKTKPDQVMQSL